MTTYTNKKLHELTKEIKEHKGYGESKGFHQLKLELIEKLGKQEWERVLHKAKFMAFLDRSKEQKVIIKGIKGIKS